MGGEATPQAQHEQGLPTEQIHWCHPSGGWATFLGGRIWICRPLFLGCAHRRPRKLPGSTLQQIPDFWPVDGPCGRSAFARVTRTASLPQPAAPSCPRAHTPALLVNAAIPQAQCFRGGALPVSDATDLRRVSFTGHVAPASVERGNGPSGAVRTRLRRRRAAHHFPCEFRFELHVAMQWPPMRRQPRTSHGADRPGSR